MAKVLFEDAQSSGFLPEELNAERDNNMLTTLGAVDFYQRTDELDESSARQFRNDWKTRLNGSDPTTFDLALVTVSRNGQTSDVVEANRDLARKQGDQLQNLMGIATPTTFGAVHSDELDFPIDCRSFTFLVVGQKLVEESVITISVPPEGGNPDDGSLDAKTAITFNFDTDNELIRNTAFLKSVEVMRREDRKFSVIEVVSIGGEMDEKTKSRAASVIERLNEEGVTAESVRVITRKPTRLERREIIRSGFLLDGGFVLR